MKAFTVPFSATHGESLSPQFWFLVKEHLNGKEITASNVVDAIRELRMDAARRSFEADALRADAEKLRATAAVLEKNIGLILRTSDAYAKELIKKGRI